MLARWLEDHGGTRREENEMEGKLISEDDSIYKKLVFYFDGMF